MPLVLLLAPERACTDARLLQMFPLCGSMRAINKFRCAYCNRFAPNNGVFFITVDDAPLQAVESGVKVFMNHTLEANLGRATQAGNMVLRFSGQRIVQVRDHVIYALPHAALSAIPQLGAELDSPLAREAVASVRSLAVMIQSVTSPLEVVGFKLFKLFLVFDKPWWTEALPFMACIASGSCGTLTHSEPDRKVHFWGVAGQQPMATEQQKQSTAAAVMVTYTDALAAEYWAAMLKV